MPARFSAGITATRSRSSDAKTTCSTPIGDGFHDLDGEHDIDRRSALRRHQGELCAYTRCLVPQCRRVGCRRLGGNEANVGGSAEPFPDRSYEVSQRRHAARRAPIQYVVYIDDDLGSCHLPIFSPRTHIALSTHPRPSPAATRDTVAVS